MSDQGGPLSLDAQRSAGCSFWVGLRTDIIQEMNALKETKIQPGGVIKHVMRHCRCLLSALTPQRSVPITQADSTFVGRGKVRIPKSRLPTVRIEEKKNVFLTKARHILR